jgi:muramoyltetrapeptide carboxypeptidase
VYLAAPSSWPPEPGRYERGLSRLRACGFRLANEACGQRRQSLFAGSDAERAADLNALCDPAVPMPDLIMLPRGGYGAVHLLDRIDYARLCPRLKRAGTVLVGYSDFTALQMALLAKGGVTTFSGPMVYTDLGRPEPDPSMVDSFRQAVTSPVLRIRVDAPQRDTADLEGVFWGGNLATLAALAGTPYLPLIQGGILFLEDVGEAPYRVDRMLYQLYYAGVLGRQKAIILGAFNDTGDGGQDPGYTLDTVADGFRARLGIPILTGLPCGHIPGLATLPVGARGRVAATPEGFTLTFTGQPVLRRLPAGFLGPALTAPFPSEPQ